MESFLGILETLFNVISFVGRSGCRVWEMMEVGGGSDKKEGLFELYETNAQPTMSNNSRNMNDTHVRILGKGQR